MRHGYLSIVAVTDFEDANKTWLGFSNKTCSAIVVLSGKKSALLLKFSINFTSSREFFEKADFRTT